MAKNEIVHYPHHSNAWLGGVPCFCTRGLPLSVVTNIIQPVTCELVSYKYFLGIIETLAN